MASFQALLVPGASCAGCNPELFDKKHPNPWDDFTLKTRTRAEARRSPARRWPGFDLPDYRSKKWPHAVASSITRTRLVWHPLEETVDGVSELFTLDACPGHGA